MNDTRSIKTYVWHGEQCYFVSTIDRDSSALGGPRYAETIVWPFDWNTSERGMMISQTSDREGSVREHFRQAAAIHANGEPAQ